MDFGRDETPPPKVVLVTGACRFLGGYLTARLAQNASIDRVIAVDAVTPTKDLKRRMGRADFVRADIRNPFIAKVIRGNDVDTVVHAAAASYAPRSGGRATLKELNVMGAMQLFAACQNAPTVRRVVLKSTSEVYGSNQFDPVMFTEAGGPRRPLQDGFGDCRGAGWGIASGQIVVGPAAGSSPGDTIGSARKVSTGRSSDSTATRIRTLRGQGCRDCSTTSSRSHRAMPPWRSALIAIPHSFLRVNSPIHLNDFGDSPDLRGY